MRKVLFSFAIASLLVALPALFAARARAEDPIDHEPDSFDLLGEFPTKDTRKRLKSYQLRTSALYGNLNFDSHSTQSDVQLDGVQAGMRVELEQWFTGGASNRKSFGVVSDLQFLYVGAFHALPGDPVYYTSASALFGWRAIGYGHTLPWTPEVTFLIGPALELFPSMTVNTKYTGELSYNLFHPLVFGAKVGTRARFPLFTRFAALEVTGYYIYPLDTVGGDSNALLSTGDTRSEGATALVDLRISDSIIAGAGFYWGWFKLSYQPEGKTLSDQTIFFTRSFLVSARFNL